jgi:hypothetical protein
MKPILLGLDNLRSGNSAFALWPAPNGCTGHRLWQMLNAVDPSRTDLDYIDDFDRRNVKDGFDAAAAQGRTVVVLGDEVRKTLSAQLSAPIQKVLIHPQVIDGVTWRLIPHASGRCVHYNDPTVRLLVGFLLADLLEESEKWPKGARRKYSPRGDPSTGTSRKGRPSRPQ